MTERRGRSTVRSTRDRVAERVTVSPFNRLARVHALSMGADALTTVSLAGSLFFSIPSGAARGKVALYLLITIAPFAVIAPLIGPAIDRIKGGRRMMIIIVMAARVLVFLLMAQHIDDLYLFPLAFMVLVLGKAYGIAKSALVPTVVDDPDELVEANSRLSLLSSIAAFAAGAPGAGLVQLIGPEVTLVLAAVVAGGAGILATQLAPAVVASEPVGDDEEGELRGAGILRASEAMGLLRGLVGFLTFLMAFDLKGGGRDGPLPIGLEAGRAVRLAAGFDEAGIGRSIGAPAWHFGAVLMCSGAGALLGALAAPHLRRMVSEERILFSVLVGTAGCALLAAFTGGLIGAGLCALAVAMAAAMGRLAFDAIVQRDAPGANFGRSFAGFETRFQLVWVIGGFIPVIVAVPARVGFLVIAGVAAFAAFAYRAGAPRPETRRRRGRTADRSVPAGA